MGVGARRAPGKTSLGGCGPGQGKARVPGASSHRRDLLLREPALPPRGGRVSRRGARGRWVGERGRGRGRGVRPGRSPAGEEVKQRVLLLLSARRHGRAGSAAPGCRGHEVARGMRDKARSVRPAALRRLPAPPPYARAPTPCALALRPPRRGRRRLTGLCGASPTPARTRRAAVTWRGPGRVVTRLRESGAARGGGVGPDLVRPLAGVGRGRGDCAVWAGVRSERTAGRGRPGPMRRE